MIHQVSLLRKHICLAFPGYWSHLVRLAHLFDRSTFRQRFKEAITLVILEDFEYFDVNLEASELDFWTMYNLKHLELQESLQDYDPAQNGARSIQEARQMHRIIAVDNGDPATNQFVVWDGANTFASKHEALIETVAAYIDRFGNGFHAPLLVRWKHAAEAQRYVREPWPAMQRPNTQQW